MGMIEGVTDRKLNWGVNVHTTLENAIREKNTDILNHIYHQLSMTLDAEAEQFNLTDSTGEELLTALRLEQQKKCDERNAADAQAIDILAKIDACYFLIDLFAFTTCAEEIISMVMGAAIKRRILGKPSLKQQETNEQLTHCFDHLKLWCAGEVGDEKTVLDQAKHSACRILLAYFTDRIKREP